MIEQLPVKKSFRNHPDEIERLVNEHVSVAFCCARRQFRDTNQSLANRLGGIEEFEAQALIKLYKVARTYDPERCPNFAAYAKTFIMRELRGFVQNDGHGKAAMRFSLDAFREEEDGEGFEPEAPGEHAPEVVGKQQLIHELRGLIDQLAPVQAMVINLRWLKELTYRSCAEKMRTTIKHIQEVETGALAGLIRLARENGLRRE